MPANARVCVYNKGTLSAQRACVRASERALGSEAKMSNGHSILFVFVAKGYIFDKGVCGREAVWEGAKRVCVLCQIDACVFMARGCFQRTGCVRGCVW